MTNKRIFVTAHKAQYAVSTLCRVMEISRGWLYGFRASQPARDQRKADRSARDLELLPKIKTFFKASKKCYGSKRIHQDLLADGETVSERRVARIMKENKVSPRLNKRRKPVTTDSNHKMRPSPDLLEQEFHCLTPNTVWLADITYIDTDEGWLYLPLWAVQANTSCLGCFGLKLVCVSSSQPPIRNRCDDRLNPPNTPVAITAS